MKTINFVACVLTLITFLQPILCNLTQIDIKYPDFTPQIYKGQSWYGRNVFDGIWSVTHTKKSIGFKAFYISSWQQKQFLHAKNTTLLVMYINRTLQYTQRYLKFPKGTYKASAYMKLQNNGNRSEQKIMSLFFQLCNKTMRVFLSDKKQPTQITIGYVLLWREETCLFSIKQQNLMTNNFQVLISNVKIQSTEHQQQIKKYTRGKSHPHRRRFGNLMQDA